METTFNQTAVSRVLSISQIFISNSTENENYTNKNEIKLKQTKKVRPYFLKRVSKIFVETDSEILCLRVKKFSWNGFYSANGTLNINQFEKRDFLKLQNYELMTNPCWYHLPQKYLKTALLYICRFTFVKVKVNQYKCFPRY